MQIVKSREYRTGFRVDPWDLERLIQELGGDEAVTRIAVELGDGSSLTVPHVAALAEVPNLQSRPITSVWIESAPPAFLSPQDSSSRLAIIQLRALGSFGPSFHVSGDERAVLDLATKIEDWVESITPWFGRLAFMDRPGLLLRGFLILGCIAALTVGLFTALQAMLLGAAINAPGVLAVPARLLPVGCLVTLAFGTLWVGMRPKSIFPAAQIRLGEGESRSDRSDRLRSLVFGLSGVVAVVAVAGSLLAGLLR